MKTIIWTSPCWVSLCFLSYPVPGSHIPQGRIFDIRRFYKKRFIRILIPFYITYLSYFIYKAGTTGSFTSFFPPETSAWKIILHSSEWMNGTVSTEFHTFSLGIGEWFLGALIILYLLFPLLRFLMKKNPCLFFIRLHMYLSAFTVLLSISYSGACEPADQGIWFCFRYAAWLYKP